MAQESKALEKIFMKTKKSIENEDMNLNEKTVLELRVLARELGLEGISQLNKADLIVELKKKIFK